MKLALKLVKCIKIILENGDDISSIFKPEIKNPLNPNVIEENKNLFSVNQAKSIYTSKIT